MTRFNYYFSIVGERKKNKNKQKMKKENNKWKKPLDSTKRRAINKQTHLTSDSLTQTKQAKRNAY
jgi:hypothetical protein